MGVWTSRMMSYVWSGFEDNPANICMLGLDAAGKTTVTYKLKLNEVVTTIPTIGFNVEEISLGKGVKVMVWDVGGQQILRPLWHHYYQNCRGVIYVVDSSDRLRLVEAAEELASVLDNDAMRGVPLVVLANKQDLPGAVSAGELIDALRLRSLTDRQWHVQATCAVNGDGVYEGMFKMAEYAKNFKRTTTTQ